MKYSYFSTVINEYQEFAFKKILTSICFIYKINGKIYAAHTVEYIYVFVLS